jgi:hypothetical protein
MPFEFAYSFRTNAQFIKVYPVANGQTVSQDDLLQLANGRVQRMATGSTTVVGSCKTFGDSVGNAAGTVLVEVWTDPGAVYKVAQGAIADGACQPGDTLDVNGTADGLAVAANNDLRVYDHDAQHNWVYVQVRHDRRLYQ